MEGNQSGCRQIVCIDSKCYVFVTLFFFCLFVFCMENLTPPYQMRNWFNWSFWFPVLHSLFPALTLFTRPLSVPPPPTLLQFGDSQQLRLVRILRSTVMVRVGGGWMALDEFLVKNDPCRGEFKSSPQEVTMEGWQTLKTMHIQLCDENEMNRKLERGSLIRLQSVLGRWMFLRSLSISFWLTEFVFLCTITTWIVTISIKILYMIIWT